MRGSGEGEWGLLAVGGYSFPLSRRGVMISSGSNPSAPHCLAEPSAHPLRAPKNEPLS